MPFPPLVESLEGRALLSAYYVSPLGSDAAAGTAAEPWQTLQKAATSVAPGDVVTVRPGAYSAGFHLTRSGTAAAPVTFRAEPGALITGRNAVTADAINLEGASHVVIEGFAIDNASGTITRAGIRSVTNTGVVIRNNRVDRPGKWGIFTGFSENIRIEGNEASRAAAEHGVYVSNSADNPVIRNNRLWGNHANGVHMNGDAEMGGDGVITGALVEGNVIYDNGRGGGSGINADGVRDSVFRNNLVYGNHASGISLYRIDGGAASTGNTVVNNTVLVAADGRWALNIQNGSTGNVVFNNILYNYGPFRGSINISADSLAGLVSDYNAVMDRFTTDAASNRLTLAQWRAASGQDAHSFVATPLQLFINGVADPFLADYHLSPASVALNKGTATLAGKAAPTFDFEGTPRPQGTGFDIGADELAVTPPTTPSHPKLKPVRRTR